jgi:multiple sugar transport system substrate-binding protein
MAVLGCGCTNPGDDAVTLQMWAMGSEGEAAARLAQGFERTHPGLRVRVQQIPWSAAHEKLLTAYVGETMPDVFQLGTTWIPELVALGAVAPPGRANESSPAMDLDDYFPGIFETNVIDEVAYAVPWYVDTRLLFYRRDLLKEVGYDRAPASWSDWVEAMGRIRRTGDDSRYAILLPLGEWEPPVIFALQLGAELLRDGDRYGNFQSPSFRRAFQFYLDLFARELAPRTGDTQGSDPYRDFAAGYFSFYISGPWSLGEFRRRLPGNLQQSWTTASMPSPEGAGTGVSIAGGASLAVSSKSRNTEAAWKLIEYLSQPGQQAELYRLTGDLPARTSAWEQAGLHTDARARAFWEQLRNVRSTPKIPEWERIAARIGQHAEAAIRGASSVEEALRSLDMDTDAILAKRRSLLAQRDTGTD